MRIALLLPAAEQPARRSYALWIAAARNFATALSARGLQSTIVSVADAAPDRPSYRHGVASIDDTLRVAQLFRQANDFDIIHDMLGAPFLPYASFVSTPVVTTVWMEMWQAAGAVYHDLNQRVFYVAPGDRDRATGLLYSATLPWALDPARVPLTGSPDGSFAFAGDLDLDGGILDAIDLATRVERPLTILGRIDAPSAREEILPRIDGRRLRWIEDPACDDADQAVRRAAALLHMGPCDGMQQLVLLDAAMGGTPVLAVGDVDHPAWMRDGTTSLLCRTVDDAVAATGRLASWDRAACRERVLADRSLDAFVDGMVEVYERIVRQQHREDRRPWGYYQVLADEPDHKVKRLVVFPGKRLSLQRHRRRDEHWYLLDGEAAIVQDEEEIRLLRGQSIEIPKGCWHRIRNPGSQNLTLIEVQTGDYFGEDDIERKEDDFGRA
jgi:mannose-6-phosphate isomerase-like protein (cupin superfamily)